MKVPATTTNGKPSPVDRAIVKARKKGRISVGFPSRSPEEKRQKPKGEGLALDPDLIGSICRDIRAMGLVGERWTGLLVYLACTSRKQNKPLSIVIRGKSSEGKSEVQARPIELMPPEDVLEATDLTMNALYWMKPGSLKHKIIKHGERRHRQDEASADRNASMRQLISEGCVSKASPVKTEGGGIETKVIEQEGPVAYIETTTATSIFTEDLNRMLQVYVDGSAKQTRAVMRAVAEVYSTSAVEVDTEAIKERHWEFQRSLEYRDVRIPYAEMLAETIPAGNVKSRRLMWQVLATIEAIAALHQFQRETTGEDRILATVEDYKLARELLLGPMHASIGVGDRPRKAYTRLHKKYKKPFATPPFKDMGFNSKKVLLAAMHDLEKFGVLRCDQPARGPRPAVWAWTGKTLDDVVLPGVGNLTVTALPEGV